MLNRKKHVEPKMQNPPSPPERKTILEEMVEKREDKNPRWEVGIFDNPDIARQNINAAGIEPQFIYSNTSGKTVVWWKEA